MSVLGQPVSVTTRHSASVYPWQLQCGLPDEGPVIGLNHLAGGAVFCYDPWAAYGTGAVTSPNMVVLGQLGKGKSSLVKTYLSRQMLAGRSAFVLDPKGEYAALAAAHDLPHLRLAPGASDRLNPLDVAASDATGPQSAARRRAALVGALAGVGLGRDLHAEERAAVSAVCADLPAAPVLTDVVDRLLEPSQATASSLHTDCRTLAASIRPTALELRRLLVGDLAGMVDGPTTVDLDPDGRGLVVDLSASFGCDALATVMVCAGSWLQSAIAVDSKRRRLLLVDEAWALLSAPATTRWLQSVSKLARGHGVQLVTVVHRVSDLLGQADDGTAVQAQARGLLADAETRVIYGQSPGERKLAAELLDLSAAETDLVVRLPPYRALWRVGRHAAVVDHVLAPGEAALVDTDGRMSA